MDSYPSPPGPCRSQCCGCLRRTTLDRSSVLWRFRGINLGGGIFTAVLLDDYGNTIAWICKNCSISTGWCLAGFWINHAGLLILLDLFFLFSFLKDSIPWGWFITIFHVTIREKVTVIMYFLQAPKKQIQDLEPPFLHGNHATRDFHVFMVLVNCEITCWYWQHPYINMSFVLVHVKLFLGYRVLCPCSWVYSFIQHSLCFTWMYATMLICSTMHN